MMWLPSEDMFACRFITALTRGGPNGMPRPIEMNAHDPRRYIADMLAWVHQAMASEHELIVSLFGQDEQRDGAVSPKELRADLPSSNALLDRVMEGVCRPLKVSLSPVTKPEYSCSCSCTLQQYRCVYLYIISSTGNVYTVGARTHC